MPRYFELFKEKYEPLVAELRAAVPDLDARLEATAAKAPATDDEAAAAAAADETPVDEVTEAWRSALGAIASYPSLAMLSTRMCSGGSGAPVSYFDEAVKCARADIMLSYSLLLRPFAMGVLEEYVSAAETAFPDPEVRERFATRALFLVYLVHRAHCSVTKGEE